MTVWTKGLSGQRDTKKKNDSREERADAVRVTIRSWARHFVCTWTKRSLFFFFFFSRRQWIVDKMRERASQKKRQRAFFVCVIGIFPLSCPHLLSYEMNGSMSTFVMPVSGTSISGFFFFFYLALSCLPFLSVLSLSYFRFFSVLVSSSTFPTIFTSSLVYL